MINIHVNRSNGRLQDDPQIQTKGFMPARSLEGLNKELKQKITEALRNSNGDDKKKVEMTVGNYLYSETRRRPMVIVTIEKR
jgi:mRNA degradation ribonuclease J1/J2